MKCPCLSKVVGAVVVALGVAAASYAFGSVIVVPKPLAQKAFLVDMSTLAVPAASSATTPTASAAPPAAITPIAGLLATADAQAGQKYAKVCSTCHSFGKGEGANMGPNLYGIVGNKHAHMAGYAYSDAMKAMASETWSFEELNHFLFAPKEHVPGTKMPFAGIKNDGDRANVIAWLRSLSDSPVALPNK